MTYLHHFIDNGWLYQKKYETMKQSIIEITERIEEKSRPTRTAYLERVSLMKKRDRGSDRLGCANVAHAIAALPKNDKFKIVAERAPNLAIVTAYNDMLSAHKPYESYPQIIREAASNIMQLLRLQEQFLQCVMALLKESWNGVKSFLKR